MCVVMEENQPLQRAARQDLVRIRNGTVEGDDLAWHDGSAGRRRHLDRRLGGGRFRP